MIRTKGGDGEEGGDIRLAADRLCGVKGAYDAAMFSVSEEHG